MIDIFDVVADATRRDILAILLESKSETSGGEICVSDIVNRLSLSQPTVSKHLKVLREAHLVTVREDGQHRYYRLDTKPFEEIEDWLFSFLSVDFEEASKTDRFASGLKDDQRALAEKIGKVFAKTSHQVTSVVNDVTPKKWRKNGSDVA